MLRRVEMPARTAVVRRGRVGDCMYFIAEGEVQVDIEPTPVRLGSGAFFGELALARRFDPHRQRVDDTGLDVADSRPRRFPHPDGASSRACPRHRSRGQAAAERQSCGASVHDASPLVHRQGTPSVMTVALNETHDPARRSFVESANARRQRFPDPESAVRRVPPGGRGDARASALRSAIRSSTSPRRPASFDGLAAEAARACAAPALNRSDGARAARVGRPCGSRFRAGLAPRTVTQSLRGAA